MIYFINQCIIIQTCNKHKALLKNHFLLYQTQKDKYCMSQYAWDTKIVKFIETGSRMVVARDGRRNRESFSLGKKSVWGYKIFCLGE